MDLLSVDRRPIGVFDSGIGGLTVVKELINAMPAEDIIYFGDTARVPYGTKSPQTVLKYSKQIVKFLLAQNVKAIVIACNTVSSNCYEALQRELSMPVFEVVGPGALACLAATKNNRVGVIGTAGTISSKAYEKLLKSMRSDIEVFSKACPLFVPLVEEGWVSKDNSVTRMVIETYCKPILEYGIDSLLLGCTHYPWLYDAISDVLGDVTIVNPAQVCANKVKQYLTDNGLLNEPQRIAAHNYFVSDSPLKFSEISGLLLKENLSAEMIDIENY